MKMFDASKTRMIGLPYGEKNYDRFHMVPERNGRTDRRTVTPHPSIYRAYAYASRGKNVSARGRTGGTRPPNVS